MFAIAKLLSSIFCKNNKQKVVDDDDDNDDDGNNNLLLIKRFQKCVDYIIPCAGRFLENGTILPAWRTKLHMSLEDLIYKAHLPETKSRIFELASTIPTNTSLYMAVHCLALIPKAWNQELARIITSLDLLRKRKRTIHKKCRRRFGVIDILIPMHDTENCEGLKLLRNDLVQITLTKMSKKYKIKWVLVANNNVVLFNSKIFCLEAWSLDDDHNDDDKIKTRQ